MSSWWWHSYGGCVISGVAERLGAKINALVYLDAFVLENGQPLTTHCQPSSGKRSWTSLRRAATDGKCRLVSLLAQSERFSPGKIGSDIWQFSVETLPIIPEAKRLELGIAQLGALLQFELKPGLKGGGPAVGYQHGYGG